MKRILSVAIVTALALAVALPVLAGEEAKEVKLTGYITDEWCGVKNANADGAACARSCAKKGSELAIFADGKLYILSDKEKALEHIGYEVVVTGTLAGENKVQVKSIEKAEKKA
jgi:hypothetical protein